MQSKPTSIGSGLPRSSLRCGVLSGMALDISPLLEKRFACLHLFVACFALCCASSFATYQFNLCVYSICICDILYAIVYIYIYIYAKRIPIYEQ